MKTPVIAYVVGLAVVCAGCGKQDTQSAQYPRIEYDAVVAPGGETQVAQLFIKNSVPVMPGERVDIVMGDDPAHAIVSNTVVQAARWKLKSIGLPKYPADGFVTLTLTKNQWESFKFKQDLRLFPHQGEKDN